ncbi:hypothetical protein I5Q34_15710 [Streptomyces sp. AV19]|uniref:hypothetical protein n=1 Tax=Streptomyces sp. AV19 TaxID=2793068 RepID=UPI0018FEF94A|nr:hypothetical protein [Streptomyces sp. AV19]MBH1935699.1 hypothetical protein [Streptomyces sp. AV19]MDG4536026.1 hypothetical protein [Streptomyces sp. AV19]
MPDEPSPTEPGGHARRLTGALAVTALVAALVALWQTQSAPLVGPEDTPAPPAPGPPLTTPASSGTRSPGPTGYVTGTTDRPLRAIPAGS